MEMKMSDGARTHINEHMDYPTTREAIVEACSALADDGVTTEERDWIASTLTEGTYNSAGDVLKALGQT